MSFLLFDQVIGGIEDGIIATLKEAAPYAKTVKTYGGELDTDQVKRALGELTPQLPALLVSYGAGVDTLDPAVTARKGEPRLYRHDCSFTVICCSGDARGDATRRRGSGSAVGLYKMIADARYALGGLQFVTTVGDEKIALNGEPLRYADVEYVARLAELTAYAVNFTTWVRFSEKDRRVTGSLVQELVFTVENTDKTGGANLPGVVKR